MKTLADRIRESRDSWLDLPGGLGVKLRRPGELAIAFTNRATAQELVDRAVSAAVDWRGFSEATFFGEAVGSADLIPFDADAWREYVADRADVATAVAEHLQKEVAAFLESRGGLRGN